MSASPITQFVAAVVAPEWLDLGTTLNQVLALDGLAGVDIRIARRGRPSYYERELAKRVLGSGKRLRIHTWMGVRRPDGTSGAARASGMAQGRALAEDALALGAEVAGANSERDVWRGPGKFANPKAVDFLAAVPEGVAEAVGGAELRLIELGIAMPAWHYRRADLDHDGDIDTEIPAEVRYAYDRKAVMAYQVDDSPVIVEDAELRTALDRARKVWPGRQMGVWLGVGRVDAQGRVWGDYAAARKVLVDRHAGVDEVTWYAGFGAIDQVLTGNPRHPALVEVVPDIASATSEVTDAQA